MTVGIDAKLVLTDEGVYDFQIDENGDIESEDSFDAAIVVSLFTDRRADSSEVALSQNRRGWIGNESTPGIEIGSKIWLYNQNRTTQTILNKLVSAARQALTWFVDQGLLESISAAGVIVDSDKIQLQVDLRRFNSEAEPKLFTLWENTGKNSSLNA